MKSNIILPYLSEVLRLKIRKKLLSALFLSAIFLLTLWLVFHGENIHEVADFLRTADIKYIIPCILCVFLFIGGEAVSMYYLLRTLGFRVPISHCWLHSFIGFFYSCITPSASGGQPMQLLSMRKDSVPPAVSTVILAILAITYKLVLVIIGIFVLILRPSVIISHIEPVKGFIYIGIVLNILCIAILMMLVFIPNAVKFVCEKVVDIAYRIRPFKHRVKINDYISKITHQYSGAADFYRKNSGVLVNVLLFTFIQRISLFAITWFTYRAFQLSAESPATIITLQSLISVASDLVPVPGGMGANENLFIEIFSNVFSEDLVLPAMVISRGISFYSQIIISGIMTIAATFILKGPRHKENT